MEDIYKELKEIQLMLWEHDDLMTQENLFASQDRLASVLLEVAKNCGEKTLQDLVASFPYLYKVR
jgi:hypothetical protein